MVGIINSNGGFKGAAVFLASKHLYQQHQAEPGTHRHSLVPTHVEAEHANVLVFIPSQKKSQNHTVSVNGVLKKPKLNPVEKAETNLQTFSMHQAWRVHEQSNSRPSTSARITKIKIHKSDKHCSPQIEGFLEMEGKCQKF